MDPAEYFPPSQLENRPAFDNGQLEGLLAFEPGMKVVDVGAGVGVNMIAFEKAGWEAWGVEPSKKFVDYGVEKLGIRPERLLNQAFEHTDLPDASFDLVSFGAVLEHLVSPSTALRSARRVLKPGGIILAEIPASTALISRLINFYYRVSGTPYVTNISPMHPPFHLYEFTHHSFEKNGKRNGYEVAVHRYWQATVFNVPSKVKPLVRKLLNRGRLGDGLTIALRRVADG
jgi:ubiquinone/menaquinone biosynthesis C-methylase UbiE